MDSATTNKHADLGKSKSASSDEQRRESNTSGSLLIQTAGGAGNGIASSPGNRHSSISGPSGPMLGGGRRRASMFDPIDPAELQKTLYLAQRDVSFLINPNKSKKITLLEINLIDF